MKTDTKLFYLFLGAILTLVAPADLFSQKTDSYFRENYALMNARVRSLDRSSYVRELVLIDFKKSEQRMTSFGYGEDLFLDDGSGFDQRAGDGIFTSKANYSHTVNFPFDERKPIRFLLDKPLVNPEFKHTAEVAAAFSAGGTALDASGPGITVECDVSRCGCPSQCSCPACDWGMTSWCLDFKNCRVKVTLEWPKE